jgi:dihydrofolate synthase / folylpolyglutamate synthase
MTYLETIEYLYSQLPVFQKIGKKALKPKLTNISELLEALGNPQNDFKSIHIAGTNGKGSSSHFLASILIESGYKVGLYTSPHLKDFRERFRINGQMVEESFIVDFVENHVELIKKINPSFFELSVALAFKLFSQEKVEIAVVEVGLGGRYDSTNIISNVVLSLITNIGYDHMDILGDTLPKIAYEKAGIIKSSTPVIISEYHSETYPVFQSEAKLKTTGLISAFENYEILSENSDLEVLQLQLKDKRTDEVYEIQSGLVGEYQKKNIIGVIASVDLLIKLGFQITSKNLSDGLKNVVKNTQLKGRWQILSKEPLIICDTGHNEHALKVTIKKLSDFNQAKLHFVLGFVKDKDLEKVLSLFPTDASYYFTTFDSFRALSPSELQTEAIKYCLDSSIYANVNEALDHVKTIANSKDIIFVGGSTYLVAELNNL